MGHAPDAVSAGRVDLRRWSVEAIDDLMEAVERSHPELARWLAWAEPMPSRSAELQAIESRVKDFDDGVAFHYFMIEHDSGDLVGSASLFPTDQGSAVMQIGYWVRTDHTRLGYATAAARALTDVGVHLLGLAAVEIRMDQANVASASVPPKLGYVLHREEARERRAAGHTGVSDIWRHAATAHAEPTTRA